MRSGFVTLVPPSQDLATWSGAAWSVLGQAASAAWRDAPPDILRPLPTHLAPSAVQAICAAMRARIATDGKCCCWLHFSVWSQTRQPRVQAE